MKRIIATLLLLTPMLVGANPGHTYITLSPKGCEQVAELVIKRVHSIPVNPDAMEPDAVTVAEYILENNHDLKEYHPQLLHQILVESCYAAQGRTDVPPRTKI